MKNANFTDCLDFSSQRNYIFIKHNISSVFMFSLDSHKDSNNCLNELNSVKAYLNSTAIYIRSVHKINSDSS